MHCCLFEGKTRHGPTSPSVLVVWIVLEFLLKIFGLQLLLVLIEGVDSLVAVDKRVLRIFVPFRICWLLLNEDEAIRKVDLCHILVDATKHSKLWLPKVFAAHDICEALELFYSVSWGRLSNPSSRKWIRVCVAKVRIAGLDVLNNVEAAWAKLRPELLKTDNLMSGVMRTVINNDDGSHYPGHQIISFQQLWPKLRPGGLYVIEDIETS